MKRYLCILLVGLVAATVSAGTVTLSGRNHRLTQADLSAESTTYRVTGDMDLGGATVKVPRGCTLVFDGGTLSGGTLSGNDTRITAGATRCMGTDLRLSGSWAIEAVYPQWYGAHGDGRTDDTAAFEAVAALCSQYAGLTVRIPRGHYVLSRGLVWSNDVTIKGDGDTSILDWSREREKPRNYMLFTRETLTRKGSLVTGTSPHKVALLAARAAKGSTTVLTTTLPDLAPGDLVVLQNRDKFSYDTSRHYYHQGEMAVVKRVGMDRGRAIIEFETPLFADYTTSSTDIIKLHPITVHLSGFHVLSRDYDLGVGRGADGKYPDPVTSPAGLLVVSGRDCTFDRLSGAGSSYTQVSLNNCFDCTLTGINVDYCSVAQGLNYGVTIGQSQNITVRDCRLRTTRHGLTLGGGTSFGVCIVNRNVSVRDCVLGTFERDSRGNANVIESLNAHGNTEYFTAEHCTIKGGVSMSGDHLTVKNCTISNAQNEGALVKIGNSHGHSIVVRDNVMTIDKAINKEFKNYTYLMVSTSGVEADDTSEGIVFAGNKITMAESLRGTDEFIGQFHGGVDKDKNGNEVAGFRPKLRVRFTGNTLRCNGTGKRIVDKRLRLTGHIKELTFENNDLDVGLTGYSGIERIDRLTVSGNRWSNAPYALHLSSKTAGDIYGRVTLNGNTVAGTSKSPFIAYYVDRLAVTGNRVSQSSLNKDNSRWIVTKQCKREEERGNTVYPATLKKVKTR